MTLTNPRDEASPAGQPRTYFLGALVGALFGLLSAYFYSRAAEDDARRGAQPSRISTGEVIGLGLAALAMVRQITEMGRGPARRK